jgi:hypothetical protein
MMAKLIKLECNKSYATEANAIKAVEKKYGDDFGLRYIIMKTDDNRFFPVFIGQKALQEMVHFNFNVLM